MKSKKQLKEELHKLIDSIEDEHTLNVLNEDVVPYVIENRSADTDASSELNEEEENELNVAIKEADNGETVSLEELLKATERWHTK